MRYVNVPYPTPPTAMPYDTAGQDGVEFLIFLISGAMLLYLVLFHFLKVIFPQFRQLSMWTFSALALNTFRRNRQRGRKNEWRKICGICSALSLLYLAGVISAIAGTLHLADVKRQNSNLIFSIEDTWAGSYALLESTSNDFSGSLCSMKGEYLAALNSTAISQGWSFQSNVSQPVIEDIFYANPVSNRSSTLVQFNASCRSNVTCVTGRVIIPAPPPTSYGDTPGPDFEGNISLIITSPNTTATLNTTNPKIWTSYKSYQGIGENYAPLGYWYLGNDPVVQIVWNTAPSGPCVGLQVFLSRDFETVSLIILGLVWQWWITWGENNGCNWADSYTTTINGMPIPINDV